MASDTYTVKRIDNTHARVITETATGVRVLVSYDTPVAYEMDGKKYRTSTKWSVTTKRHLRDWYPYEEVPQSEVDAMLKRITGDIRFEETRETTIGYKRRTRGVGDNDYTKHGNKNLFIPVYKRSR